MSASVTEKSLRRRTVKAAIAYLAVSAFCVLFDAVYARFGHGVRSAYMDFMFLYPLLGGALPFGLLAAACTRMPNGGHSRFFFNCLNSGIAALTTASLLHGICAIAGTQAPQAAVMAAAGWGMALTGMTGYWFRVFKRTRHMGSGRNDISKEMPL